MQAPGQVFCPDTGLFVSPELQQVIKPPKERRKNCGRACFKCRQLRIKCDYQRPCHNCVKRNEECRTDDDKMSCLHCRKSKLKCDKQKPCSRCIRRGKPEECVSQVQNGVPEEFRPKETKLDSPSSAHPVVKLEDSVASESSLNAPMPSIGLDWRDSGTGSLAFQEMNVGGQEFVHVIQEEPSKKRAWVEIYNGEEEEEEAEAPCQKEIVQPMKCLVRPSKRICLTDTSRVRADANLAIKNKILLRMWEAGYSQTSLENLFGSLPPQLHGAMEEGLRALETLAWLKAQSAKLKPSSPSPSSGFVTPDTVCQTPPDDFVVPSDMVVNDVYDNLGCGWWCLSYDPVTGRRSSLEVNNILAKMLCMHPEELLARAGHSDVRLPCSQLEFFCTILDDLCNAGEQRLVRYSTVTVQQQGKVVETMLVRRESLREFNEEGKIVRMQHLITRVSEDEYDAAFRSDPSVCRPFYSVMGDFRSANDILADAARDLLFDEQILSMAQTEEGAKKLKRLQACLRVRFEPIIQFAEKAKMKFAAAVGQAAVAGLAKVADAGGERREVYARVEPPPEVC